MSADRFRFTTIGHAAREHLGPLSPAAVDFALDRVSPEPQRTLEVGCGKGALLVRALQRFGGTGVGVEPNPDFAAAARKSAAALAPRATLLLHECDVADAALPEASFGLAICVGASQAFGTPDEALAALVRLVPVGALVLYGDGYWRKPPAPEYAEWLGGEHSMGDHAANAARGRAHGLACLLARESTHAEWDAYEDSYAASVRAWCDAHPEDADAPGFRARIERWNDAYRRHGRDTLGFGLYLYRRAR